MMSCNNSNNIFSNNTKILRKDGSCEREHERERECERERENDRNHEHDRDRERECGCGCGCRRERERENDEIRLSDFCNVPKCPPVKNFCCEGITPDRNSGGKSKDIFAYVNQIVDSKSVQGTQLNEMIRLTPQNCDLIAEFTDCNGCSCAQPVLDSDSCFKVLAYESKIDVAFPTATLPNTAFVINKYIPSAVISDSRNMYELPLANFNNAIYNDICTLEGRNSSAPLIVAPMGTTITYQASFVLCGTVTSNSGVFKFKFIIDMDEPITSCHCTSFMLPEICLPRINCFEDPRLLVGFCYDSQLVAPNIDISNDGQLVFTSALMISPTMKAETVVNKKVILNVREIC